MAAQTVRPRRIKLPIHSRLTGNQRGHMKLCKLHPSGLAFLLAVMAASRSGRADGPDLTPGVWKKITPASVTITPTNHVFCQGVTQSNHVLRQLGEGLLALKLMRLITPGEYSMSTFRFSLAILICLGASLPTMPAARASSREVSVHGQDRRRQVQRLARAGRRTSSVTPATVIATRTWARISPGG